MSVKKKIKTELEVVNIILEKNDQIFPKKKCEVPSEEKKKEVIIA